MISLLIAVGGVGTKGYAASCSCSDWMNKGGYCVDYVKEKIPTFPIPQNTTEIASLKNKEISEISEGDVAIFNFTIIGMLLTLKMCTGINKELRQQ
jgi:hypothetical protein